MFRLRPGWLVALCAAILAITVWLPWLTTRADGGRRRSEGRCRWSARMASIAALVISLLLVALTLWYYHINVHPPVSAGYGFYIGMAVAVAAVAFSAWTLVASMSSGRRVL